MDISHVAADLGETLLTLAIPCMQSDFLKKCSNIFVSRLGKDFWKVV